MQISLINKYSITGGDKEIKNILYFGTSTILWALISLNLKMSFFCGSIR